MTADTKVALQNILPSDYDSLASVSKVIKRHTHNAKYDVRLSGAGPQNFRWYFDHKSSYLINELKEHLNSPEKLSGIYERFVGAAILNEADYCFKQHL